MKKFLVSGIAVLTAISATNALAADVSGYVCDDTVKKYRECLSGSYPNASGNCVECPELYIDNEKATVYFERVDTTEHFADANMNACALRLKDAFDVSNGSSVVAPIAPLECVLATNDEEATKTGVAVGSYVCAYNEREIPLACNSGYYMPGAAISRDDEFMPDEYTIYPAGWGRGGEIFLIDNLDDLDCEQVPAGFYSDVDELVFHNCGTNTDLNEDGIYTGYYCHAGSMEPRVCPSMEAYQIDSETQEKLSVTVYGVTDTDRAKDISDCHLPVREDIWYKDTFGFYSIEPGEACTYIYNPSITSCEAYKLNICSGETDCYIDCDDMSCGEYGEDNLIYDPEEGNFACYEAMDCASHSNLASIKADCAKEGGIWDSANVDCRCPESGQSFSCEAGEVVGDNDDPGYRFRCVK